jgi:Na+-translocating ferredoxin:NAD+ oxidoreductase RNF subunit RnfB
MQCEVCHLCIEADPENVNNCLKSTSTDYHYWKKVANQAKAAAIRLKNQVKRLSNKHKDLLKKRKNGGRKTAN